MSERMEVYLQRAQEFQAMAESAESQQLKETYLQLARGYIALARYRPDAKQPTPEGEATA